MGVFKNEVGRPSNETIKKRNILKIVCALLVVIVVGLSAYILNDKLNDENVNNEKNEPVNKKIMSNKDISKVFEQFVKENNLMISEEEIFDTESLKNKKCITANLAIKNNEDKNGLSAEMFEFEDVESAKKEYNEQKEYQLIQEAAVMIYSLDIINLKTTEKYELVETKKITDDVVNANEKVYDYSYLVRIDNYVLSINSVNYNDNIDEMQILRNKLNSLLNIEI